MLTIGVVAYNNPEEIIAFAEHLEKLDLPNVELMIWDNSENGCVFEQMDNRGDLGKCFGGEGNIGFGAAHNRLYEQSGNNQGESPYYLVSNADVKYEPECIPTLIGHLEKERSAGLAAPRLLNEDGTLQLSCRTFYTPLIAFARRPPLNVWYKDSHPLIRQHLMADVDHTKVFPVDWVMGAVMLIRREAIKRENLFDSRYFLYFEDVDLCRYLHDEGRPAWYCGDAVAIHSHHRSSARNIFGRSSRWHIQSCFRYFRKYA